MRRGNASTAIRAAAKAPFIAEAQQLVQSLASMSIPEFIAHTGAVELRIEADAAVRHGWQIGAIEQQLLGMVARAGVQTAFEIGTFDGGTTRALAEAVGSGGTVHTIDLEDAAFDQTQHPREFTSADVGRAFRGSSEEGIAEIVQHRGDTLTFDFTLWRSAIDLVLVDGAHDFEHGLADSRAALTLARPGGWIFWDDFEPYWHGLVNGIVSAVGAQQLTKIERTSLAFIRAPLS